MNPSAEMLHEIAVSMVEALQIGDDCQYRAMGKHAARAKAITVVALDRLRPSRVWEGYVTADRAKP